MFYSQKRDIKRDRELDGERDECVTESVTENLLTEKASQSRRNVVKFQKKNQWKKQQFSFKNMRITYYSERCS